MRVRPRAFRCSPSPCRRAPVQCNPASGPWGRGCAESFGEESWIWDFRCFVHCCFTRGVSLTVPANQRVFQFFVCDGGVGIGWGANEFTAEVRLLFTEETDQIYQRKLGRHVGEQPLEREGCRT